MKIFIWISTFLVLIFANTLVVFAGGLALNYYWVFLIATCVASALCKIWDKHKQKKESVEDIYTPSKLSSTPIEINIIEPVLNETATPNDSHYREHRGVEADVKEQKRSLPKFAIPLFILSLIIVFLIFSNIILYLTNQSHIAALESKEEECEVQEKLINSLRYKISELEELEDEALYFEEICSSLTQGNGNIGYASEDFRVDKGVIVLSATGSAEKLMLTTDYRNGCSVTIDTSSEAAQVSFDEDNWYGSTTLTVEPQYQGVCVATFSNDINLETFKILIIVIEHSYSPSLPYGFEEYWS